MDERIFGDREKAMEDAYFRDQNAKLLDKLRQRADLDEIAQALGEKLQVDNPDLLAKVRALGITLETAPAFFLAPLVQVAWAEGKVSQEERDVILRVAQDRGIAAGSPALAVLNEWLQVRPLGDFFDTAVQVLKAGFEVLPEPERDERAATVLQACREVAQASAGLGRLLGLGDGVSNAEAAVIEEISGKLKGPR